MTNGHDEVEAGSKADSEEDLELENVEEDGPLLSSAQNPHPEPKSSSLRGLAQRQKRFKVAVVVITIITLSFIVLGLEFTSSNVEPELDSFQETLKVESERARELLLRNIGPRIGAGDGLVVASPSKGEKSYLPDYCYTWTRDSALVYRSHTTFDSSSNSENISSHDELLLRAYVQSQIPIQTRSNPSGGLEDGGLNEPKFQIDGSSFLGNWGRPQRDGPALRALALIPYAHFLLDRGYPADHSYVKENLYNPDKMRGTGNVIKNDLEEVAHRWWKGGFDLWEEVNGHHFFTLIVSLRALQAGSSLADRLIDSGAQEYYSKQAESLERKFESFWSDEKEHYLSSVSSLNLDDDNDDAAIFSLPDRQWSDCSLPLSLIHAGDQIDIDNYGYSNNTVIGFGPADPKVISTIYRYIQSFDGLYKINNNKRSWTQGWALGRYREDVYDGVGKSKGNPWHICINAIAQSLYLIEQRHYEQGYIEPTEITNSFWTELMNERVNNDRRVERYERKFEMALRRLREVGDSFLNVSRNAMELGERMSEQIGRDNGKPIGARDLTWSYASLMTAVKAREDAVSKADNGVKGA
ncbi:hypothetical protein I204_06535 [Kwoniella mangroviensis CBS 8886]|uniref:uncharacterized protein n=1 Tax=Kwoniella mangroviensis CBS 8507 TaxID=1296122 RepID=UPI00080D17DA|nr:uncharacterized protein I203_03543 [Kwoniella mangroviensis CBS 8507]OCF66862.1 hypothetical protein I203_03543 [Kwoniella mangroviensis CBS 8507]OCF73304.1 hypothetical protein I204_06535 [Kwoniella mangroviensis CBS 8886]